ncbi:MAG: AAA family ATPase [Burkholderiales bacterium]|nr:AAA family ATPase [Burkholderiales bacterium]
MYAQFFGLKQEPFSIAPDPRYLFMSERHREALAHLLYGVGGGGGFVLLTGEIGAGKTTVCRAFLEQIPKRCNVAYIFNPKLTVSELLKSVCDEFHIPYPDHGPGLTTVKDHLDPLNAFLLRTHAVGQNNVLIIDEAQNLSADVLEQLRLLTNLETSERKLLQIVLIGQPELRDMLARPELEQLAQRVIARYHLGALTESETAHYIRHRLTVAGLNRPLPFDRRARKQVHELSRGVPRRINLLCDRALLGAYAEGKARVDSEIVDKAASEVFGKPKLELLPRGRLGLAVVGLGGLVVGAALIAGLGWFFGAGVAGPLRAASAASAARPAAAAASAPASGAVAAASAALAAASAASAPAPVLSAAELTTAFGKLTENEREAWRELAPAWKLDLTEADPCAAAKRQQVPCFRSSTTLAQIRQLGRPGILTLQAGDDKPVYAVLVGLSAQAATLRMGGALQAVPLVALAQWWRGDFATFWRAPEGYRNVVADGSSGPVVDRLAADLARLRGEAPPSTAQRFDADLRGKVFAFQLAQGLRPDGIAGPTTFMQLNRATGVDEPRLQTDSAAN